MISFSTSAFVGLGKGEVSITIDNYHNGDFKYAVVITTFASVNKKFATDGKPLEEKVLRNTNPRNRISLAVTTLKQALAIYNGLTGSKLTVSKLRSLQKTQGGNLWIG